MCVHVCASMCVRPCVCVHVCAEVDCVGQMDDRSAANMSGIQNVANYQWVIYGLEPRANIMMPSLKAVPHLSHLCGLQAHGLRGPLAGGR